MHCFRRRLKKGGNEAPRGGGGARGAPYYKTIFETVSYCSKFMTDLAKYAVGGYSVFNSF